MPTSPYAHLYQYILFLDRMRPTSILDIGLGNGKLGFIARDLLDVMLGERYRRETWQLQLDGIEIFDNYIQDHQRAIYDQIHIGDAYQVIDTLGTYDMIVLGDVLEHFTKERGWRFLDKCFSHANGSVSLFVPLGEGWKQPAIYNNPNERHRSAWFQDEFDPMSSLTEIYPYKVGPYGAFLIEKNNYIDHRVESLKTAPYFSEQPFDRFGIRERYQLDKKHIDTVDLSEKAGFAASDEYRGYLLDTQFKEHYRLLAHLSRRFKEATLFDIGTHKGCSALALSYNPNNRIISYDIQDRKDLRNRMELKQIDFQLGNALEDPQLLSSPLILLDTYHDGTFEARVINFLIKNNYRGLLVLDDIYLNAPMMMLWEGITLPKEDVTDLGHWSGTGLVDFSLMN